MAALGSSTKRATKRWLKTASSTTFLWGGVSGRSGISRRDLAQVFGKLVDEPLGGHDGSAMDQRR